MYIKSGISLIPFLFFKFQMSGLGQSPMALLSHDSNSGGGSNHSSAWMIGTTSSIGTNINVKQSSNLGLIS